MNHGQGTLYGTTILAVRVKDKVAVAGDGQVTLGETIMKHSAKKIRRLYKDRVIVATVDGPRNIGKN